MRTDGNLGSTLHYEPNSYGEWQEQPAYKNPSEEAGPADIYDFREDDDNYFEQPGKLFNIMSPDEQQRLFENTARNMEGVENFIKERHIIHCYKADPKYGEGVAKAMGIDINSIDVLKEVQYH